MNHQRTHHKLFLTHLIAAAALLAAAGAHGQTWQSENVLLPGPDAASAPSGVGAAVLVNPFNSVPAPGVFVGLNAYNSGEASILRLTASDISSSSFTSENLDSALTFARGLAYNPGDALYAACYAPADPKAKNVTYIWKVRKSIQQGNPGTWVDDDTFVLGKNAYSTARKVAIDPQGNVFVAGVARDARLAASHWIVRRKTPGAAWTTVFDGKGDNVNMNPSVCYFPGNANNSTPAMFTTSDLNSKWTVMRSQQQGASGTWQQVDSWTGGGTEASAYDITFDSVRGNLYVVGCRGLNGKNPSAWVIRMSTNGGDSWTPLLDAAGAGSWASMAAVDVGGNVTVCGVINPTANTSLTKPLWKVIRCTDPQNPSSWSASFANVDTLPFGESTYSKGAGVVADAFGNMFVTGMLNNWTDTSTSPATTYSSDRVGLLRMAP